MKPKKAKITTNCVANHYAASNERIVEFSFPGTSIDGAGPCGGLISFRTLDDGTPIVQVYRCDRNIEVTVSKEA